MEKGELTRASEEIPSDVELGDAIDTPIKVNGRGLQVDEDRAAYL